MKGGSITFFGAATGNQGVKSQSPKRLADKGQIQEPARDRELVG